MWCGGGGWTCRRDACTTKKSWIEYFFISEERLPAARRRIVPVFDVHDVTGLGLVVEVQLDPARLKLSQHTFHALRDGGMVGAIAGDELLDYGA